MVNKDVFEKEIEKRAKKRLPFSDIEGRINYEKFEKPSAKPKSLWVKIGIPVGSLVAVGVVALSLYEGGVFPLSGPSSEALRASRLVAPTTEKVLASPKREMSETTYASYRTFARNFVALAFDNSIKTNGERSLGVSIPDAYMCFALAAITSTSEAEGDFLSFMGLNGESELKEAASEVVSSLCTLKEEENGDLSGGYNLNSLWFNPKKVNLLPKDEDLYSLLGRVFDASIYNEALTSDSGNAYLASEGLKGFPTPRLALNDEDPLASAAMSVYYCVDGFAEKENLKSQYDSGTHKMAYFEGGVERDVDYIADVSVDHKVYEGDGFTMAKMRIRNLDMSYYLPDEEEGLPSGILGAALSGSYEPMSYVDEDTGEPSSKYEVSILAPYFKLENDISLDGEALAKAFPNATSRGLNEKMAQGIIGPIRLSYLIQDSLMSFDYNGFHSCSATIVGGEPGAPTPPGKPYDFSLSHPYLFSVEQPFVKVGSSSVSVPLTIGEIVDPGYAGA
ncbi:MAG: hypothetical protein LKK13_04725 [Bacilli bacterium]|jgi:hypothetical protein|nr:hypothetical protein [Bacilli bacterium]